MKALVYRDRPKHLHSMTHLLQIRKANSFEQSTFLVSLLLGLGYDAYVVSGYASRETTFCNQRMLPCPDLSTAEEPPSPEPEVVVPKYRPTSPPTFRSRFLDGLEARKRDRDEQETRQRAEERQRLITELERPPPDRLFGQRVHAWVLVLPNAGLGGGDNTRDVERPMFIEASTGVSYDPGDRLTANCYLGVESLWNAENYWVNVQDCSEGCAGLAWDLGRVEHWEHLLAGEPERARRVDEAEEQEPQENAEVRRGFHMVMPASYLDPVRIPYKDFEERYPGGKKTTYYKKAKLELYSPYSRLNGMTRSVTKYEDYEYAEPIYAYESYEHRADGLFRSEKDLVKEIATDFYHKERPDGCKSHSYGISAKDLGDEDRTLEFHEGKRLDDLLRIRMHPLFMQLEFRDTQPDRLYSRYVEYSPYGGGSVQNDVHYRPILKIVEKFHKSEAASGNVATREFDFVDNEVRLTYHFRAGEYTPARRTFVKPAVSERGDRLVFFPDMTSFYKPDPTAGPDDFEDLVDLLELQLAAEDASVVAVRNYETMIVDFLQTRSQEFTSPVLEVSRFDPIRNGQARAGLLARDEKIRAQSQREVEGEIDYLAPYFARLGNIKYLTKSQAMRIRDDCLGDFKQLLVDRANALLRQFEKASNDLEKLQAILSQSEGLTREEKEHYSEEADRMNLKLHSLKVQLSRIRANAPGKYRALLEFLEKNSQLAILYENETDKKSNVE